MKLYEMTKAAADLYELLSADEIDEETFNTTLEAMGAEEKLEGYCAIIRELESDADKLKAEKDRIAAKQKTAENGVKRMKEAIINYLHAANLEKAKAGTFSVAISKSKAVVVADESAIPLQYLIAQPAKIDKASIRSELMEGRAVPGATLQINEGVRIR